MKKLLRFADCFVLLAAIIGCMLRLWLQNTGIDTKGLYRTDHPAWLLLLAISLGLIVFLWFATRSAGDEQGYPENFPRSITGGITYILMALVLTYVGVQDLLRAENLLETVTAMACLVSAVMLGGTCLERMGGHQPIMVLHMIPCLYFALRLFCIGRALGTEPEICTFLFGFLGAICLVMAFYHLLAFDMNMGNRGRSLFWSLSAAYFCLISTFESSSDWVQYMVFAAFLLSNVCQLKHLPAQVSAQAEEAAAQEPAEEVPVEETAQVQETQEMPAQEIAEEPAVQAQEEPEFAVPPLRTPKETLEDAFVEESRPELHDIDPEADMDAFLADLRQYLDKE